MVSTKLFRPLLAIMPIFFFAAACQADEVIFDSKGSSSVVVGDFDCSNCPTPTANIFSLFDGNPNTLTAGELWMFFDKQGFNSIDHLTLCLDMMPSEVSDGRLAINSMELKIEDPVDVGTLLTNVSLGNNSLVFNAYDVTSFKPEAKLQVNLGYDFMARFSADSKAKISLAVTGTSDVNSQPIVSIEGGNGFFAKSYNVIALAAFAIFWTLVFVMLNRLTKPNETMNEPVSTHASTSTTKRALSA